MDDERDIEEPARVRSEDGAHARADGRGAGADLERLRLRAAFDRAPAAISITDGPEHRFVMLNPAFRRLVPGRDPHGLSLREAFPELADQGVFEIFDEVFRTGEPFVGDEVRLRLDATGRGELAERYFTFVTSALSGAGGKIEGLLTHCTDVTDLVRSRLELERRATELALFAAHLEAANEELDQFAYVTSHDLRAPLRGIANLSQWIEDDLAGHLDTQTGHHLALLRGRVARLEELIDGILAYARAGRRDEEREPVDVRLLVVEVIEHLAPPPDAVVDVEGPMPVLSTERAPLREVLQNLVSNALRHGRTARGSTVRITAAERDGAWRFSVRDEGPGIDPRFHDRIWGIFQTLRVGDGSPGTGIGLSLVRKIVEGRGGRVELDSALGAGAAFHFTWPERGRRAPRLPAGDPSRPARSGEGS